MQCDLQKEKTGSNDLEHRKLPYTTSEYFAHCRVDNLSEVLQGGLIQPYLKMPVTCDL